VNENEFSFKIPILAEPNIITVCIPPICEVIRKIDNLGLKEDSVVLGTGIQAGVFIARYPVFIAGDH
jgi:hypothetical protein